MPSTPAPSRTATPLALDDNDHHTNCIPVVPSPALVVEDDMQFTLDDSYASTATSTHTNTRCDENPSSSSRGARRRRSRVEIATLWNDLGNIARDNGKFEQAATFYQKALDLFSTSSSSSSRHPWIMDDSTNTNTTTTTNSSSSTTRVPRIEYSSSSSFSSTTSSNHSSSSITAFMEQEDEKRHALSATLLGNLGLVASDLGHDEQALQCYVQALHDLEGDYVSLSTTTTKSTSTTSTTTPTPTTKSKSTTRKQRMMRHLNIARTYNNMGALFAKQGNVTQARHYYDQALDKYYETLWSSYQNTTTNTPNATSSASRSGCFPATLPASVKTPDVAVCFHNVGNLCLETGALEEAAAYLERALDIHSYCAARRPPTQAHRTATITTLETLGELCVELGRYAKALEYYQQVLDLQQQQQQQQSQSPQKLTSTTLSTCIVEDMQADVPAVEAAVAPPQEDVERTAGILGVLNFELGRYQQAKTYFEMALEWHSSKAALAPLPSSSQLEDIIGTLEYLGQVEHKLGHHQKAREYEEQAVQLLKQQKLALQQDQRSRKNSRPTSTKKDPLTANEEKKEEQTIAAA